MVNINQQCLNGIKKVICHSFYAYGKHFACQTKAEKKSPLFILFLYKIKEKEKRRNGGRKKESLIPKKSYFYWTDNETIDILCRKSPGRKKVIPLVNESLYIQMIILNELTIIRLNIMVLLRKKSACIF